MALVTLTTSTNPWPNPHLLSHITGLKLSGGMHVLELSKSNPDL